MTGSEAVEEDAEEAVFVEYVPRTLRRAVVPAEPGQPSAPG